MATVNPGSESGSLLGRCPICHAEIPQADLLITYESAGGWPMMFAACNRCETVVHPS